MAHVAWRQSGLPPTNVIGAGCNLDSERVSHALDINLNTHKPAWVIGELSDNKGEPERIDYVFTRRPRVAFSVCSSITQLYYLIQPLPSPVVLSCDHLGFICFALNRTDVTRNAAPPAHRVYRFPFSCLWLTHMIELVSVCVLQLLWWATPGWAPAWSRRWHQDLPPPNRC